MAPHRLAHEPVSCRQVSALWHQRCSPSRSSVATCWEWSGPWQNFCSDRATRWLGMVERMPIISKLLESWCPFSRLFQMRSPCSWTIPLLPCGRGFTCVANRVYHPGWFFDKPNASGSQILGWTSKLIMCMQFDHCNIIHGMLNGHDTYDAWYIKALFFSSTCMHAISNHIST